MLPKSATSNARIDVAAPSWPAVPRTCLWSEQERAADELRHCEGGDRDEAIRQAAAAGLSLSYIQRITGLGKTTIMRILNNRPRPRP